MKYYILFACVLFLTVPLVGQKINFQIVDGATGNNVKSAHVISSFEHNFLTFSDDSGRFALKLKHNDTLIITKDYYHTIYVNVQLNKFDTAHILVLKLMPSPLQKNQVKKSNFNSLESFEYHFVHDKIGEDSHAKIHVFEHVEAKDKQGSAIRPNRPDDMNMKIILPENRIHMKHQQKESAYKLKE